MTPDADFDTPFTLMPLLTLHALPIIDAAATLCRYAFAMFRRFDAAAFFRAMLDADTLLLTDAAPCRAKASYAQRYAAICYDADYVDAMPLMPPRYCRYYAIDAAAAAMSLLLLMLRAAARAVAAVSPPMLLALFSLKSASAPAMPHRLLFRAADTIYAAGCFSLHAITRHIRFR